MVDLNQLDKECEKTIEHFKNDLGKMRTGRANTGMLENINVDYYGSNVPLIQLGLINAPEPRLVTIQVYDSQAVDSVEKAIQHADLGFNPSRDGNMLRINIPALTEERRKDLIKKLHKMTEEVRISMRNHRRDTIDVLKMQEKDKEISEDDLHRGQDEVQKVTDKFIALVDKMLAEKEVEMMEV